MRIDDFCRIYVKQKLSDEWHKRVKACAYEFGTNEDDIEMVLRVALRDALLELRGSSDD